MERVFHADAILLPHAEPNIVDSFITIFYQGTDTIDGVPLRDLLVVNTEDSKLSSAKNSRISMQAMHETLLHVAERHIHQCLGLEWVNMKMEDRRKSYSAVVDLVDFVKYQEVGKFQQDAALGMDLIYINYVQPYMWRCFYEHTYTYRVMPKDKASEYITKSSDIMKGKCK